MSESDFARVEHRPAIVVAGVRGTVGQVEGKAELWEELVNSIKIAGEDPTHAQQLAIVFGVNADQKFDYMAGVVINSHESAEKLQLDAAEVPAGDYAIVDVRGPAPLAATTGMDYLMGTFLPEHGLRATGPMMEIYGPGDTSAEDYAMQVWVPITAL